MTRIIAEKTELKMDSNKKTLEIVNRTIALLMDKEWLYSDFKDLNASLGLLCGMRDQLLETQKK